MTVTLLNVSHCFATSWVLSHVNLSIPTGACVLLTGDNGAGKTTLLRLIAKALQPTQGKIQWNIEPGKSSPVGLITHQHYLYEALNAVQNLRIVAQLLEKSSTPASLLALLQQVDLQSHANLPVSSFSAGMKKRLALARLLLIDPTLILLDEPFGQLDLAGIAKMQQFIANWCNEQKTVILCTHDLDKAKHLCDWHLHLAHSQATFVPIPESTP